MTVGQKTTEVAPVQGVNLKSDLLGNFNNGTARFPVDSIPQLSRFNVFVDPNETVELSEAEHFARHLNLNNADGPITIRLPDSDDFLENEEDSNGDVRTRGGLVTTFTVASPAFPVLFEAVLSGNLRASGNPFQSAFSADQVYVGARPEGADEAVVLLFKRGGLWVAWSSHGWRSTEDGDELQVTGDRRPTELLPFSGSNRNITAADDNGVIWLTGATPGTFTFDEDLEKPMLISVVNSGGATATFDFTGHTQLGATNSVGAGQAATIAVGPVISGTNREIIILSSG